MISTFSWLFFIHTLSDVYSDTNLAVVLDHVLLTYLRELTNEIPHSLLESWGCLSNLKLLIFVQHFITLWGKMYMHFSVLKTDRTEEMTCLTFDEILNIVYL